MRTCALLCVLLSGCTSLELDFPTVWRVNGNQGSVVPFAQVGPKLWLLTAKHLLPVFTVDGFPVVNSIPHPLAEVDLALLSVETQLDGLPLLAQKSPKFGEHLHAIGWHMGQYLLVTDGRQGYPQGVMSAPIIFGVSGGAVLNPRGELVGIVKSLGIISHSASSHVHIPITHVAHYELIVPLRSWILEAILP